MSLSSALVQYAEPHNLWFSLEPPADRPASGSPCPHCHSLRTQKWGWFGKRQRYRCKDCARTYNDLTGTVLARLKQREKWAELGLCLIEGLSVRGSARALGVCPSTAFRWRHRFVAALRAYEKPRLTGVPELTAANLVAYRRRLMAWAKPFRGVSAKYYSNYLAWFSFVDERRDLGPDAALASFLSKILPGLSLTHRLLEPFTANRGRPLASLHAQGCGRLFISTNNGCEQSPRSGKKTCRQSGSVEREFEVEERGALLGAVDVALAQRPPKDRIEGQLVRPRVLAPDDLGNLGAPHGFRHGMPLPRSMTSTGNRPAGSSASTRW